VNETREIMKYALLMLFVVISFAGISAEEARENESESSSQTKTVYKWVDKNGKVHFSDQPKDGAKKMTVRNVQSVDQVISERGKKLLKPVEKEINPYDAFQYKSLEIVTPEHEQAQWSNDGVVNVSIKIEPKLRDLDRLKVTLNGEVVSQHQNKLDFILEGVERGEHLLTVEIIDERKVVKKTAKSKFYIHKMSKNRHPNNN
jgi:hypothetical protein